MPDCPEGKILNPATNRCVNINGAIGKKLSSNSEKRNTKTKSKSNVNASANEKGCPTGKILNPATNRCVDSKGAIGKKLLKNTNDTNDNKNDKEKKILIIDDAPEPDLKEPERSLKKLLPNIPASYFYNIDDVILKINDTGYSRDYKLNITKKEIKDLNDIYDDVLERMNGIKSSKVKTKYMSFMNYHKERQSKIQELYNSLLVAKNKQQKK